MHKGGRCVRSDRALLARLRRVGEKTAKSAQLDTEPDRINHTAVESGQFSAANK